MDYNFFTILRSNLNSKSKIQEYKISYDDKIILNDDFKNFFNLKSNSESLLKIYKLLNDYIIEVDDINHDLNLKNLLKLTGNEKLDKINIYNYFNKLLIIDN